MIPEYGESTDIHCLGVVAMPVERFLSYDAFFS